MQFLGRAKGEFSVTEHFAELIYFGLVQLFVLAFLALLRTVHAAVLERLSGASQGSLRWVGDFCCGCIW